jgi:hypothetical protein
VIGADGESTVCAVSYRIAGAIETECPSCLFAWTMPLSDEEVRLEGVECAKFVGLNDTSLVFGHAESDQLMVQKSGVWIETPGKSETSGSAWTISIFVAPM